MGLKQNAMLVLKCDMRMRISFEINKIAKEHLFSTKICVRIDLVKRIGSSG